MSDSGVPVSINIDAVKAAEGIVKAIGDGVESAERSCVIEVDNQLPVRLTLDSSDHDHGGFGTVLPKGVIEPMSFDVFNSRSSGFLTGTEGHVFYTFRDRKLFVHWNNPFAGGNSSDTHVEPDDPRTRAIAITGNGNHGAHMRFIIAEIAQVPQPKRFQPHSGYFIQGKFGPGGELTSWWCRGRRAGWRSSSGTTTSPTSPGAARSRSARRPGESRPSR